MRRKQEQSQSLCSTALERTLPSSAIKQQLQASRWGQAFGWFYDLAEFSYNQDML